VIEDIVVIEGSAESWKDALLKTYKALYKKGYVKDSFFQACIEREKEFPTGLPTEIGVAIPHTDSKHVIVPAICVFRLEEPVRFQNMGDSEDSVDVHFIFNMALKDNSDQVPMLQSIIKLTQDKEYLLSCKEKSLSQIKQELMERWCNCNSDKKPSTLKKVKI
jgi:galactitol PTS system EIIA component